MINWQELRQKNLLEMSLVAHVLAYLITIIILIVVGNLTEYTFYVSTLLLGSIVLPAALFILLDYHYFQQVYNRSILSWWNISKHTALFVIITVVLANSPREQLWLFGSIYLLPVVLSCITLGKNWGITFAGAATISILLLTNGTGFPGNQELGTLEATLVLGGVFFLLAWFLGGILEIEKENARQLRQEKDLIARMMDTSPAGIMVLDRSGKTVYANTRLEQIFGLKSPALNKPFNQTETSSLKNPFKGQLEVFHKVMSEKKPALNYSDTTSSSKGEKYLSISGAPIFDSEGNVEQVVLTVNDITQQKKMNEEIMKTEKLNSISILAGGIAHDFNNFMTVILGNISLVQMRDIDEKSKQNVEHMEKAALQARELTGKLFVFARGGTPVKKPIHLRKLLKDTIDFVLSGSTSFYKVQIAEDLYPTEADEAQIGQVINNVLINALQAMPEGGRISLTACNLDVRNDMIENTLPLSPGQYVRITIVDEGIGIPSSHLDKIFDPFFSTKPDGTGLGLATCHTIVQNHGGLIQVESQPGIGTEFNIYLPASNRTFLVSKTSENLHFGEGNILIMDDDELILKTCGEMLRYLGYRFSCTRDGSEAIKLYQEAAKGESKSAYDAVIMDLTVPGGMGGKEAIKRLKRLNPEVKAIVSSGYSDDPVIASYKEYGFSGCVNKPYQIKELSEALANVLECKVSNR